MPGSGTPKRSIRIPDELWQAALAVAKRRGETLNAVIRAALERYVAEEERDGDSSDR
jgi:predicted DNA-binding protein